MGNRPGSSPGAGNWVEKGFPWEHGRLMKSRANLPLAQSYATHLAWRTTIVQWRATLDSAGCRLVPGVIPGPRFVLLYWVNLGL